MGMKRVYFTDKDLFFILALINEKRTRLESLQKLRVGVKGVKEQYDEHQARSIKLITRIQRSLASKPTNEEIVDKAAKKVFGK